jgi:hypothetical protein
MSKYLGIVGERFLTIRDGSYKYGKGKATTKTLWG